MISKKAKPGTITEYIKAAPRESQEKLSEMLDCIQSAAPGASEGLKWGMPAFSYKRILVTFAIFKNHIGFYPTPDGIEAFKKELASYEGAKGSVQFANDQPLPLTLIAKIVKFRVKASVAKAKAKKK